MARGRSKRQSLKKRGGAYSTGSPAQYAPVNQRAGSRRNSRKTRRQTLTRKQKRSRKQRKSFLSTLNQMGGYIRDGSSQFFRLIKGDE